MYIEQKGLHNHMFTEVKEGFIKKGIVIIDIEYAKLFDKTSPYNKYHVLVNMNDFLEKGGRFSLVAISN